MFSIDVDIFVMQGTLSDRLRKSAGAYYIDRGRQTKHLEVNP